MFTKANKLLCGCDEYSSFPLENGVGNYHYMSNQTIPDLESSGFSDGRDSEIGDVDNVTL